LCSLAESLPIDRTAHPICITFDQDLTDEAEASSPAEI